MRALSIREVPLWPGGGYEGPFTGYSCFLGMKRPYVGLDLLFEK